MNHGAGDGPAPTVGPVLPEDDGEPVTLDDQRVDKGKTTAAPEVIEPAPTSAAPHPEEWEASEAAPPPLQPLLEQVTPQNTGRISPEALDAGSSQAEQASNAFKQDNSHIKEGLHSSGGFDNVDLFTYRSDSDEEDTVIAEGSPSPKQSTSSPAKPLTTHQTEV